MFKKNNHTERSLENSKLYSSKAISLATFLGGPLAAGYLVSENFKALNKNAEARISLVSGVLVTIFIFSILFLLPEKTLNYIPRQVIPLIYTGIVWVIVEWTQGEYLKEHEEKANTFFSKWRAAGIGFISLLIIGIGIFPYILYESNNPAYEVYDIQMAKFSKNEKESLVFFDKIDSKSKSYLLSELDNMAIPKWKENIEILNELKELENLPDNLKKQSQQLLKYSELRLQLFELLRKGIDENTSQYDRELEMLSTKIEAQLNEINE